MKLESNITTIDNNIVSIFEKLENVSNFKRLMPENLDKFSVLNENSFTFALKGMPEICLEKKQITPHTQLSYGAKEGKIPFELSIHLSPITQNQTQVQFRFEGNFNPMMAMMVKAPIGKLIETMVSKISEL